ncbi:hypothetical protein PICMEDRAFT_14256 [Pichia membranifaciens NRRL Y-2026]|uniref:AB hydrolase-1 domain-containing protein n=1 Tax=Pichia membranifaciens NRRL Y-2026 TaxID=763406 RepID=A0A1E3NRM0_9ASCO|nr:hypothetical protein PICMEDRAFT_14256 [Pichia membranifaciens NRRL Y-2026]ODQ48726.1 hypothetical protein PICMEDRAFT_14256 [Pichia membranifaciens NRRL Y-2026]
MLQGCRQMLALATRARTGVFAAGWRRYVSRYDGTPGSLGHSDLGEAALDSKIETVELVFDKHVPPANLPAPLAPLPPIVFLHGLFGSRANNRSVSRQLAKRLNTDVYCLDLRNHGDSPHNARHDYPAMAADVERFIAAQGLQRPVLVGHSMGAKCAMAVTLRRPELCAGLVAVDNAPVNFTGGATGFSKFGQYIRQLQKIERDRTHMHTMKDCDRVLAEVEDKLPVRQFLETNLKKRAGGHAGYYSRVPLDIMAAQIDNVSSWPFNSDKTRWNGPTLVVRGLKSAYVADEFLHAVALFFPRFTAVDIDAGHWLISEKPKEFMDCVARWIDTTFEDP